MQDTLILAPMQGITDAIYRNTHHRYFGSFQEMMAPYLLAHGENAPRETIIKKIFQHKFNDYKLIPQILGNDSNALIKYIQQFNELGYTEVNLNLGCPYEFVTRKKRGSGLLPFPELIKEILSDIFDHIQTDFSVKIRLGLQSRDEIYKVLEVLNFFPLKEIIIHARTADQKYEGVVYLDEFENYLKITKHQIVYNGDIYTKNDFEAYKKRFPTINRWMIGRGAIINPLLPNDILNKLPSEKEERYNIFIAFYNAMFDQYKAAKKKDDKRFLNRIKEIWSYQAHSFDHPIEVFNVLKNITSISEFEKRVKTLHQEFNWLG